MQEFFNHAGSLGALFSHERRKQRMQMFLADLERAHFPHNDGQPTLNWSRGALAPEPEYAAGAPRLPVNPRSPTAHCV